MQFNECVTRTKYDFGVVLTCGQVDLKRYAPQNEKIEGGRTIFLGDMALGVSEDAARPRPLSPPIPPAHLKVKHLF